MNLRSESEFKEDLGVGRDGRAGKGKVEGEENRKGRRRGKRKGRGREKRERNREKGGEFPTGPASQ